MSARPRFSVQLLLLLGGMPNSTPDQEKNRFSARAARYASVGANVGGVAARMAGARFLGMRSRPRQERRGARRGARRPEGPDHEGGAAPRHHPGRAAAGIHHRADQAAEPGAADGLGLRQAPHAGRAWARLARRSSQASSIIPPRRPRSARCIARSRRTAPTLACKLQYADMQSAVEADLRQLGCCSPSAGAWIRRSTPAR